MSPPNPISPEGNIASASVVHWTTNFQWQRSGMKKVLLTFASVSKFGDESSFCFVIGGDAQTLFSLVIEKKIQTKKN